MLKRLAIATILLVPFFADCESRKADLEQRSQNPSPPIPPPPVKQGDSPSPQGRPEQHVNADVKVVTLPPKDWQDVAAFVISIVLALVGIIGVFVGIATVLYIKRQAFEMGYQRVVMRRTLNTLRRQSAHMQSQVEEMQIQREQTVEEMKRQAYQMEQQASAAYTAADAAKISAEAAHAQINAMKAKERARIAIDVVKFDPFNLHSFRSSSPTTIHLVISNNGSTQAVSVAGVYSAVIAPVNIQRPSPHPDFLNVKQEIGPFQTADVYVSAQWWFPPENAPEFFLVHVWGKLEYEDIFDGKGNLHTSPFEFRCQMQQVRRDGTVVQHGEWQSIALSKAT